MKRIALDVTELTPLQRYVLRDINRQAKEYESDVEGYINDLQKGGCQSGLVSKLIYYTDTVKFYKKYKADIKSLLQETMQGTGLTPTELFGDKWDEEDIFCDYEYNQNLLAWFGYEETAFNLAREAGIDL